MLLPGAETTLQAPPSLAPSLAATSPNLASLFTCLMLQSHLLYQPTPEALKSTDKGQADSVIILELDS